MKTSSPISGDHVAAKPATTQDKLKKIPGVPCLYRHEAGQYYVKKKFRFLTVKCG